MSAVLAREKPERAQADIVDLLNLEWRVADSVAVYHTVALHEPDAMVITADVRYYNKARDVGRIALLENFSFEDVH